MSEHNKAEQVTELGIDAAIDTAANQIANKLIHSVVSHLPGGQSIEALIETEADLILDNAINQEVSKRVEGVEEVFDHRHHQRRDHENQQEQE